MSTAYDDKKRSAEGQKAQQFEQDLKGNQQSVGESLTQERQKTEEDTEKMTKEQAEKVYEERMEEEFMDRPHRDNGHSTRSTNEDRNKRRPQDLRLAIANTIITQLPGHPSRKHPDLLLHEILRASADSIEGETPATSSSQQPWSISSDQSPTESSAHSLRVGPTLPSMQPSSSSHGSSAPYRLPSHSQEQSTFGEEPSTSLPRSSGPSQLQSFNSLKGCQQDYLLPSSTSLQQSSSSMQPFAPDLQMGRLMMQSLPGFSIPSMNCEQSFVGQEPRPKSFSSKRNHSLDNGLPIEEDDSGQSDLHSFNFGDSLWDYSSNSGQSFADEEPPSKRSRPSLSHKDRDDSLPVEQDITALSEQLSLIDNVDWEAFERDTPYLETLDRTVGEFSVLTAGRHVSLPAEQDISAHSENLSILDNADGDAVWSDNSYLEAEKANQELSPQTDGRHASLPVEQDISAHSKSLSILDNADGKVIAGANLYFEAERPNREFSLLTDGRHVSLLVEQDVSAHSENLSILDNVDWEDLVGDNRGFSAHTEEDINGGASLIDHSERSHILCEGCPELELAFQDGETADNISSAGDVDLGAPPHRKPAAQMHSEQARANPVNETLPSRQHLAGQLAHLGGIGHSEKLTVYPDGEPSSHRLLENDSLGRNAPSEAMIPGRPKFSKPWYNDADHGPVLFKLRKGDSIRARDMPTEGMLRHGLKDSRAPKDSGNFTDLGRRRSRRYLEHQEPAEVAPVQSGDRNGTNGPNDCEAGLEGGILRGGFSYDGVESSSEPSTCSPSPDVPTTILRRSPRRHRIKNEELASTEAPKSPNTSTKSRSKRDTVSSTSALTSLLTSKLAPLCNFNQVPDEKDRDSLEPNKRSSRRSVPPKKETPAISRKRKAEDEDLNNSPSKKVKPAAPPASRRRNRRRTKSPLKTAVYKCEAVAVIDREKKITVKYANAGNVNQEGELSQVTRFGPPLHGEDQGHSVIPPHWHAKFPESNPRTNTMSEPILGLTSTTVSPKKKTAAVSRKRKAEADDLNSSPSKKAKSTLARAPRRRTRPRPKSPKKTAAYKRDAVTVIDGEKKITVKYADAEDVIQEADLSQVVMFGPPLHGEDQNSNFLPSHWQAPVLMSSLRTNTTAAPVFGFPTVMRSSFPDTVSPQDLVLERFPRTSESAQEAEESYVDMRADFGVFHEEEGVDNIAEQGALRGRTDSGVDLGEGAVAEYWYDIDPQQPWLGQYCDQRDSHTVSSPSSGWRL